MANQKSQNEFNPAIDKHKRHWNPKGEQEEVIIKRFLALCQEKLPSAVIAETPQSTLQKTVDRLYSQKVSFEDLQELDMDQFHDYLIGQRRLFDDLQQSGD